MKGKQKTIVNYVFLCLVLVALVLVVVGMFVGEVTLSYQKVVSLTKTETAHETIKLFGDWGNKTYGNVEVKGLSNAFAVVSFIVTLVGLVALVADGVLRNCLKKDIKLLRIVASAVTVVGAILILVSGLVLANQCYGGEDGKQAMESLKMTFSAGAGVWLGFVGGLVGGVFGALPLLKPFN